MLTYTLLRVAANLGSQSARGAKYEAALHEHASQGYELVQILIENPAAVPHE